MEKILTKVLNIFLYFASAATFFVGTLLMYAAYRDGDFELSLLALLTLGGAVVIFNTARKK